MTDLKGLDDQLARTIAHHRAEHDRQMRVGMLGKAHDHRIAAETLGWVREAIRGYHEGGQDRRIGPTSAEATIAEAMNDLAGSYDVAKAVTFHGDEVADDIRQVLAGCGWTFEAGVLGGGRWAEYAGWCRDVGMNPTRDGYWTWLALQRDAEGEALPDPELPEDLPPVPAEHRTLLASRRDDDGHVSLRCLAVALVLTAYSLAVFTASVHMWSWRWVLALPVAGLVLAGGWWSWREARRMDVEAAQVARMMEVRR